MCRAGCRRRIGASRVQLTCDGKPVLVVDDHDDAREMLELFLGHDGCNVCTAAHGAEALERIAREAPCLILLDVTMPVMDGPTFARRLRALPNPEIAATPIVLLTGIPNPREMMRKIGAIDAIDAIQKPVS